MLFHTTLRSTKKRTAIAAWALALFVMATAGCAQLRLPRIDPSGNSIFLPGNASTQFILPGSNGASATNLGTAGNQINPIFPPTLPSAAPAQLNADPFGQSSGQSSGQPSGLPAIGNRNGIVGNGLGLTPQNPAPTMIAAPIQRAPQAQRVQPAFQSPPVPLPCGVSPVSKVHRLTPDPNRRLSPGEAGQLIMTPSKIIAPVGSEVVVLAGICGEGGRFLKNKPLEWMLSNNSVGEFIEIGGMHHRAFNQLIPPTSKKLDGQYAKGRTGLKRLTLSRGTPTPDDDISLAEGQTYVSVSSASPGVSYVTGVAPNVEGWDRRRAITTIHWVDANWSIPVPIQATAGTVSALTTVVSRTDGSGVKDWPVRYTIVGGAAAEFAPAGSETAEAFSDKSGKATVQIRQPEGQFEPGTTQVRVDIVRPPILGQPELIVESGITTVTWSAPALTIRAIGPRTAEFDTPFKYTLEITNPGDQIARNVIVRTKDFSDNAEYISATPKPIPFGRNYEWQIGDVPPNGAPQVIEVDLRSQRIGNVRLCFEVASDTDRLQTEACAETEIVNPCIAISIDGPQAARRGEEVTFLIRVENQCNEPLENVTMVVRHDMGLVRTGRANPATIRIQPNGLLNVGDTKTFPFTAVVQQSGPQCISVDVTADGIRPERDRACVNVNDVGLPVPTNPPTTGPVTPNSGLRVQSITTLPPEGLGDDISTIQVRLTNETSAPLQNITLITKPSGSLAPAFVPDETTEVGVSRATEDGTQVFTLINRLIPGQSILLDYGFRGLQNDPNAGVEISATSPSGINSIDSIRVPARTNGGGTQRRDVLPPADNPRDPIFDDGRGIGIPTDDGTATRSGNPQGTNTRGGNFGGNGLGSPTPGTSVREELFVKVQPLDDVIRSGQKTKVAFIVKNNTNQVLNDVEIDFIVPNTLIFGENERFSNTGGYQLLPGFRLPRINNFPPGAAIEGEMELVGGTIPGNAIFEIQVRSDKTSGTTSDQTSIRIQ